MKLKIRLLTLLFCLFSFAGFSQIDPAEDSSSELIQFVGDCDTELSFSMEALVNDQVEMIDLSVQTLQYYSNDLFNFDDFLLTMTPDPDIQITVNQNYIENTVITQNSFNSSRQSSLNNHILLPNTIPIVLKSTTIDTIRNSY